MTNDHGQPEPAFNATRRIQRDLAEMLGLAKGILFDGVVSEDEAMALMSWADDHREITQGWPGNVLYRRLRQIFADGHASDEEREDLKDLLEQLVGGEAGMIGGETATSHLPLDDPPPTIEIPDRVFVFTGRMAYGTRRACADAVKQVGGWVEPRVTTRTDILVVGTFGSRDWAQTSFGNKIRQAVEYREKYEAPAIVSERHWAAGLWG